MDVQIVNNRRLKLLSILGLMLFLNAAEAQTIKFKCKALGPFTTPLPDADSGNYTPTGMGWVEAIAISEKRMWASSNSGGLYTSEDRGKNWQFVNITDEVLGVLDININPDNEDDIIVSTGTTVNNDPFGLGVWQTLDGGKTWFCSALKINLHDKIAIWQCQRLDKTNGELVAVAQNRIYTIAQKKNVYKEVWSGNAQLRQLLQHPINKSVLYASGTKLLVSADYGNNWEEITYKLTEQHSYKRENPIISRIAIAVSDLNPDYLYAAYSFDNLNYVQLSRDKGKTWQILGTNRTFGRFDIHHAEMLIDLKDSNTIYVGAVRLFKSVNNGQTFELMSNPVYGDVQFMHDDIRAIIQDKTGMLYTANDGGVSKSSDFGKTWQSINGQGLTVTQVYSMALNPLNNKEMMLGCQDMSTMRLSKDKWANTSRLYGDGGPCLYWQTKPFKAIVSQNTQMLYSDNDGQSWSSLGNPEITNKLFFPLINDPINKEKIYAGLYHLWMKDGEKWWQNLSKEVDGNGYAISSVSVISSAIFRGYLAFDQPVWKTGEDLKGKLYKGKQIGEEYVWKDITNKIEITAWRGITSIATLPEDTLQVWVGLEGLTDENDKNRVFYSADGGESFKDISAGLPKCNINKIAVTERRKQHVWAATDLGLYYFDGDNWLKAGKLSPNIIVKDVSFSNNGKQLFFATYGMGSFVGKVKRRFRR